MQELQAYNWATCVSGSYDPPGQLVPPESEPIVSVPSGPGSWLTTGGVKIGPSLYLDAIVFACSRNAGVKSIRSSTDTPFRLYAGGFVGIGCVGEYTRPAQSRPPPASPEL